ncbi:MAG: hypothetical protein JWO00_311 [Candidatus Parcubacteria bacterium]|nr:hypothetical protein [Candidatus Parcubacteria bacterium]
MKNPITVETIIQAPIEKIWDAWTEPEHIKAWSHASDDWHTPAATNDLRTGGRFSYTMAAKDGAESFDLQGTYIEVEKYARIEYVMDGSDARRVIVEFAPVEGGYKVTETFDPEDINPIEMQRGGWQAILDNFKKHVLK